MLYNVISYLEYAKDNYPDKIALSDSTCFFTYKQVWEKTVNAGSALSQRLGKTRIPVLVSIRHCALDVISFFSVLYSGNFYVPVDLSLPENRISDIVKTMSSELLIVYPDDNISHSVSTCTLDELSTSANCLTAPWKSAKDTDLMYVIFTSGSTGTPKGVAVCHRSVIDMVERFCETFEFEKHSVFGNQAPFDFDVSVKDIYISLKLAGRLEILEKKLFSFPRLLLDRLNEREIDTVIWAVPALKIMSGLNAFKTDKPRFLKNILFSGEVMPPKCLEYWQTHLPDARFVNLYGPTEITCNCTYYVIGTDFAADKPIPIGKAFGNCSVFLLDSENEITEQGVPGEICVTGSCLALGYYNRPDLTSMAFVQNPLCTEYPELMYRTGDIGQLDGDNIVFMGRKDTQIKHMGHRIEMSEIEICANSLDGVDVSACVYDDKASRLVMFYKGEAEPKSLYALLREKLPRYMLPNELVPITTFPITRTGKIDRRQLLEQTKRR